MVQERQCPEHDGQEERIVEVCNLLYRMRIGHVMSTEMEGTNGFRETQRLHVLASERERWNGGGSEA